MTIAESYELLDRLYAGYNCTIYRARARKTGARVVLKIARPGSDTTRLQSEFRILQNMAVPGIVAALAFEEDATQIALVLEDHGGETLATRIARGSIGLREALRIAAEIAEVLGHIHGQSVIHKDINPNNILIDEDNRVRIFDFDLAVRVPREFQDTRTPSFLAGTLPYISPEQSGRMNRPIDDRTDLYSLGVTLYEMLTGEVPFLSRDPIELIHCHMAKTATPPAVVDPSIPAMVSDIVMKLLEKAAEARYQNARGLKADLDECLRRLEDDGSIAAFMLGAADISDRLQIPQRLYGRQREIAALEASFARVLSGASELLVVTGISGIGKSSVIHEIYKPLARSRGYFAAGKFDELKRDIPYSALLQALSELVRTLLTEPDDRLALLRKRILLALSGAGRLLTDVLPELTRIIGPQPTLPELPVAEGRTRFRVVFESFVRVFTLREQPLVLFLDDLQWADAATLDLLPALLGDTGAGALFVVGAYRDGEVTAMHPLSVCIDTIEKQGRRLTRIAVGPISVDDTCQLVEQSLLITRHEALPLAELLWRRTEGNPLFIGELLLALHKNGLVELDPGRRSFRYDIAAIQSAPTTDSIGQLMSVRAAALAGPLRQLLKHAAVLGSRFDLETLARVAGRPPAEVRADLDDALQEGMIVAWNEAGNSAYGFLHDRIQQAIYELISEEERLLLHERTGRLMLENRPQDGNDDWLFTMLHHLNLAALRVVDPALQHELSLLNLAAAKRATASGAFAAASNHYNKGIQFLSSEAWTTHHELMFSMHHGLAACKFVSSEHTPAEQLLKVLFRESRTVAERVQVYELMTIHNLHVARYAEAIGPALKALELLGIKLDETPSAPTLMLELLKTKRAIRGMSTSELLKLPGTTDPDVQLMHRMIIVTSMVAFFTNPVLYGILALKMIQISLKRGYSSYTAQAFSFYGIILIAAFGSSKEGEAFGRLSLDLLDRFPDKAVESRVKNGYGYFINPWRNPARSGLEYLEIARQCGLMAGDMLMTGYIVFNTALLLLMTGQPLDSLRATCAQSLSFARSLKHDLAEKVLTSVYHAVLALQGDTQRLGGYSTSDFDESRYIAELTAKTSKIDLAHYWVFKVMVLYHLGLYEEALVVPDLFRDSVKKEIEGSPLPVVVEHHYYSALLLAATIDRTSMLGRQRDLLLIAGHLRKLKKWAEGAPANFRHKYLIVQAELSRLRRNPHAALGEYEEAIALARQNKFVQDEAIALELASAVHRGLGMDDLAIVDLARARQVYLDWGAHAKVALLDAAYPGLAARAEETLMMTGEHISTTMSSSHRSGLDVPSMIKASQVLSREVNLDKLILRLMSIVAENAGAERGSLVLLQQGARVIAAEFSATAGARLPERRLTLDESESLPHGLVNYVFRTQESVILSNAGKEGQFIADPYILRAAPQAVLCMPLLQQGEVAGALYLENNLIAGAFTSQRAELLSVLCAQMAISIDNASLYSDLEQKVVERTRELREAQARLVQLEREATEVQMAGGFAHEMRNALTGANIMLSTVYRTSGAELVSACSTNVDNLIKMFVEIQDHLPESALNSTVDVLQLVNQNEKQMEKVLGGIERALLRGLRITDIILSYAEIGTSRPGTDTVSVAALVDTIVKDFQHDCSLHGISMDVDVPASCVITGNELHFQSILKNLVLNARDALVEVKDANLPRRISIRASESEMQVVVVVEDTGVGIPPEVSNRIFDPFFSTKPQTGTGLGLGMAKKLASLYGGEIGFDSVLEQGTTFRVVLPRESERKATIV